ncbi:MAG: RNA ligase family protein [Alphaproteobacteria bacterium]|nr:RNA ligase family protein [Alphaproteobacteria bacterium]
MLRKYPRTRHIEGSRLQPGDEDLAAVPFTELAGKHLVVEEKIDGANAAFSFDAAGTLLLQSRGHYLTGGGREKHFNLFKTWASCHQTALRERVGDRYIVYGEWVYAKHTIHYDRLPHYFLEFDVYDRQDAAFLSTPRRRALLAGLPLASVPVLEARAFQRLEALTDLVRPALYKSPRWRETLAEDALAQGLDADRVRRETDPSPLSEGLYIKWEEDGQVQGRFKWVRASFLTSVVESGSHWLNRPILPNRLAEGVDLYDPTGPTRDSDGR